jgi:thymidylate synthase ThyX
VTPPELTGGCAAAYAAAGQRLLDAYHQIHGQMVAHLSEKLQRPDDMKPDAYQRNIAARAFDVARYTLFFGIPTGVGQVTSIRTLERQIRRLKSSEYAEIRELADEIASACAQPPACAWDEKTAAEPLAPTLARHVEVDEHALQSRRDLESWARENVSIPPSAVDSVDLLRPTDAHAEVAATLLYAVTDLPFRDLYELACSWSAALRNEVMDVALRSRTRRDELLRGFRGGLYAYDIVMDIGAYRDLHRHRRCQQYRQAYSGRLGFDTPQALTDAGIADSYATVMSETLAAMQSLPEPGAHSLLPFGARSRFLFKMDFAEAEYISRLRSGVKGHFSYRRVAWDMKQKMQELEPELGRLMEATPPWVEDPLKR